MKPTKILALEALTRESMASGWSAGQLSAAMAMPFARLRFAEAENHHLLGFVLARRVADLLEIDLVGVLPNQRRQGIARGLLTDLLAVEYGLGLAECRLELAATNHPARALYEALGFVVVGTRTRYYPDGDDALLLTHSSVHPQLRTQSPEGSDPHR